MADTLPAHHNGSFWFDSLDELAEPAPPETLPAQADVAIVGGGFTGLWAAYYLRQHRPELGIAVFEAETVGYGGSGRNGGWCMGMAMGIEERLHGPDPSRGLAWAPCLRLPRWVALRVARDASDRARRSGARRRTVGR